MKNLLLICFVFLATLAAGRNIISPLNLHKQNIKYSTAFYNSVDSSDTEDEAHFSAGLGLFALSGFIFLLLCVGAGIVLTSFVLLIIFGFISAGILSASLMVGLNKRSFTAGFKTLIFSTGIIIGTITGVLFFSLLHKVSHWWTMQEALLMGACCGLIGGYLLSLFTFYVIRKLSYLLKRKA